MINHGMAECKVMSTSYVKSVSCANPDDVYDQQAYQAIVGTLLYLPTKLVQILPMLLAVLLVSPPSPSRITGQSVTVPKESKQTGFDYCIKEGCQPRYFDADWAGDIGP